MEQGEWWLWRLVTGRAAAFGTGLVALGISTGYALGIAPLFLALGGSLGVLLVTGLLFKPYCLVLLTVWLVELAWLTQVPAHL